MLANVAGAVVAMFVVIWPRKRKASTSDWREQQLAWLIEINNPLWYDE